MNINKLVIAIKNFTPTEAQLTAWSKRMDDAEARFSREAKLKQCSADWFDRRYTL